MIVLDANILVRAFLGRRVRQILDAYGPLGAQFRAPEVVFEDAEKYAVMILEKRGGSITTVPGTLSYLRRAIEPVTSDLYGSFEEEARRRLRRRHEDDWPILASALALKCDIWTEDADFFGTGVATWTTNRVEILLKKQASPDEP
ncbi:MAG TPA: PIN domain-containing protein [Candidatus Acidoferrales bacterium]|nr:PIN domain-containing protein [Candidatus Acidoferrales bacterium]